MTYPNEPESPRRDPNTGEPIVRPNAPYQEGYVEGQKVDDGRLFVEEQRVRDNDNAARGMLIGIIVASLLGLGVLAWYFLNQRSEEPVQQIIVPQRTSPAPQASPSTPPDVNIIVPSGQPAQAPAPAPDVDNNITVPSTQPSQAPEPAPEINNNITIPSPAESPSSEPEVPAAETPTSPSDTPDTSSPSPVPGSQ